jgi:hypothetical protein
VFSRKSNFLQFLQELTLLVAGRFIVVLLSGDTKLKVTSSCLPFRGDEVLFCAPLEVSMKTAG